MCSSEKELPPLPSLAELGADLLHITRVQQITTLLVPFACVVGYLLFAYHQMWFLAVPCLVYLSFITYGSTSHDLVHRSLGLPRWANELFLTTIELFAFRSGHAYRMAHLHHHARFPHDDMDTTRAHLNALNSHLVPLIAHDRAGFGGAVLNVGFLILACTWCGKPSRSLWQALALAGGIGFTAAIAIHPIVGYNNPVHLAPACAGALAFTLGICLSGPHMLRPGRSNK